MANPWLSAKNSDLDTFLQDYDPIATPRYATSARATALLGATSNRDAVSRAAIAARLLDDGADPRVVTEGGISVLHPLLTQRNLNADDAIILQRILDGGADVNLGDWKRGEAPLALLYNNYSARDENVGPIYDVLFARPDLNLDAPASRVNTVRQLLALTPEYKPKFQRRVQAYASGKR